jgi:DNA repair protein RadC
VSKQPFRFPPKPVLRFRIVHVFAMPGVLGGHLNSGNMLIRDELVSEGSIDQAAVYVREVIRRAMDLGSAAIILVHNHPSGDPKPSKQDIALTRDMVEAGRHFGISVHDHVIIGAQGHSSMRALGLL